MKHLFALLLACCALLPTLFSQSTFIAKELACPSTYSPGPVQLADMDSDGDLDLVLKWYKHPWFLIHLNNGGTIDTFPTATSVPGVAQGNPSIDYDTQIVLTDWNNDGRTDVIIEDYTDKFWLSLNQGSLAFSSPVVQLDLPSIGRFSLKDVNNDMFPDFFINNSAIYLNNNGSVTPIFQAIGFPNAAKIDADLSDFDGDGNIDMVCRTHGDNGGNYVGVFRNTGNFQFVAWDTLYSYGFGFENYPLKCANLDNQGPDEVLFNAPPSGRGYLSVFDSQSNSFTTKHVGYWSNYEILADFDNNGLRDILSEDTIYYQIPNQQFIKRELKGAFNYTAWGDTDGNNRLELWRNSTYPAQDQGAPGIIRTESTGGQGFGPATRVWRFFPFTGTYAMGDFDKNGEMDVAYVSQGIYVLSLQQNGVFKEKPILEGSLYHNYLYTFPRFYATDFDGDGWLDLITYSSALAPPNLARNIGGGNFENKGGIPIIGAPNSTRPFGRLDFDNDGKEDMISLRKSGVNLVWNYLRNADTAFVASGGGTLGIDGSFADINIRVGDFNQDNFQDFALYYEQSSSTYYIQVFQNNSGTGFTELFKQNIGPNHYWFAVADVTNDGIKDILYSRNQTSMHYLACKGDGSFDPVAVLQIPQAAPTSDQIFVDINHDGLEDWLAGGLHVALNYGGAFSPFVLQSSSFGPEGFGQFIDFDFDGDLDIGFDQDEFQNMPFRLWENVTTSAYRVTGQIFFDDNGNGLKDPGEAPMGQTKVGIGSLNAYAISDSAGVFNLPVGNNQGNFEVGSFSDWNAYLQFSGVYPAPVSVTAQHPTDTVLIGVKVLNTLQNTLVQTISSHRCAEVARLWLNAVSIAAAPVQGQLSLRPADLAQWTDVDSSWAVSATGQLVQWNLQNIAAFSEERLWADMMLPPLTQGIDTLVFYAELKTWNGADTTITIDTLIVRLTCAFDPNDKQIANLEHFLEGDKLLTLQDEVEYFIRFQNTGTDTAFQVVIRDFLAPEFDISTLQFLASSHEYRANADLFGNITVEFPGINLPDSSANFTGSMGFLRFSVRLKPDAERGKDIPNSARIFFDQNPPVFTNTAVFQRVECNHFIQLQVAGNELCSNSLNTLAVPSFGLEQQYAWYWDGQLVSVQDTAVFSIENTGAHALFLQVNNRYCSVDTLISLQVSYSAPDGDFLAPGDTAWYCNSPTSLNTPWPVDWFVDGNFIQTGNYILLDSKTDMKIVANYDAGCPVSDTLLLRYVDLSTIDLIENQQDTLRICPGEPIELTATVERYLVWQLYYADGSWTELFGNPLYLEPASLSNLIIIGSVAAFSDVCVVWENLAVQSIAAPAIMQGLNQLSSSNGQPVSWFYSPQVGAGFDSLAFGAILSQPLPGFYFLAYNDNDCVVYSDTILYPTVNTADAFHTQPWGAWVDFESKVLHVKGLISSDATLRVFNAAGLVVFDGKLAPETSLEKLGTGVYFAQISNNDNWMVLKAIIQK